MTISLQIKELLEIEAYRRIVRTLDHAYEIELASAGTAAARDKAEYRHHWETLLYHEQIAAITTRRLLRKADRLNMKIGCASDNSPMWRKSSQLNSWVLTAAGSSEVQSLIRQECNDRRHRAIARASVAILLAPLAGLVGWLRAGSSRVVGSRLAPKPTLRQPTKASRPQSR